MCVSVHVCTRMYVHVHVCVALSGSCAVWMLRPLSAACQDVASLVRCPVFYESCEFGECYCLFALSGGLCVCVCVCVKLVRACVTLSGSFEWVLCCLDVTSVVSSLLRCVLSGTLCFMSESQLCEFGECDCSGGPCVCV